MVDALAAVAVPSLVNTYRRVGIFKFDLFVFFVLGDDNGVAPALRHFHRNDLILENTAFGAGCRAFVGSNGELVLLFTGNVVFPGGIVGANAHDSLVVGVGQPVFDHAVHQFAAVQ